MKKLFYIYEIVNSDKKPKSTGLFSKDCQYKILLECVEFPYSFDTLEEAEKAIELRGQKYVDYTIVPVYYKAD